MGPAICYLVVALLACGAAFAGAPQALGQEAARRTTAVRRISTVIGASVAVKDAERIAKVEDIVINDNGCIDFLLVVANEDRFVLIPWNVAVVEFDRQVVRIDVTREAFLRVPTFTKDRWADVSNAQFLERTRTAFVARAERRGTTEERRGTERRIEREGSRDTLPPPATTPERPGTNRERPARPPEPERPSTQPPRGKEPAGKPAGSSEPVKRGEVPKGPQQDR